MHFKNVALVGKYQATAVTKHIVELASHLKKLGLTVYIDCVTNPEVCDIKEFTTGSISSWLDILDAVLVIGGDGTLLSVARKIVDHDIPIIGINQGRLGFMTDIAVDQMCEMVDQIFIEHKFSVETRSLIHAKVLRDEREVFSETALNDVVVSRGAIGNMIEFEISIDNYYVLSQKSDGVIFSTPTGSTAYSLAAGGPILHPMAEVFSIVPICPQSLSNRPLVVHDKAQIEFYLSNTNATQIHFDGQECFDLTYKDKVILSKYYKTFRLIHPQNYNYYKTLRTKLDWSKRVS